MNPLELTQVIASIPAIDDHSLERVDVDCESGCYSRFVE